MLSARSIAVPSRVNQKESLRSMVRKAEPSKVSETVFTQSRKRPNSSRLRSLPA